MGRNPQCDLRWISKLISFHFGCLVVRLELADKTASWKLVVADATQALTEWKSHFPRLIQNLLIQVLKKKKKYVKMNFPSTSHLFLIGPQSSESFFCWVLTRGTSGMMWKDLKS